MSNRPTMALFAQRALFACLLLCGLGLTFFGVCPAYGGQAAASENEAATDDPITACIAQNADDAKRHDCMVGIVTAAEQDVERAYQDALRIRRGRAEETRANASDIEITDSDWNVVIESQTAWRQQYEQGCGNTPAGDTAHLSCQYDLLRARLHDLQQMN